MFSRKLVSLSQRRAGRASSARGPVLRAPSLSRILIAIVVGCVAAAAAWACAAAFATAALAAGCPGAQPATRSARSPTGTVPERGLIVTLQVVATAAVGAPTAVSRRLLASG